jgi:hypothetical protein
MGNPRRSVTAIRAHELDEAITAYWRNRRLRYAAASAGSFHASGEPLDVLLPEGDWQRPGPHAADPFPAGTDHGQNAADWDMP